MIILGQLFRESLHFKIMKRDGTALIAIVSSWQKCLPYGIKTNLLSQSLDSTKEDVKSCGMKLKERPLTETCEQINNRFMTLWREADDLNADTV